MPSWTPVGPWWIVSYVMNGSAFSTTINLSSYLPSTAKYARLLVNTIDGDSWLYPGDTTCNNMQPLQTTVNGIDSQGVSSYSYVYNIGKASSSFYAGNGYVIEIPVSDKLVYINKPLACGNTGGGGMTSVFYLIGYM